MPLIIGLTGYNLNYNGIIRPPDYNLLATNVQSRKPVRGRGWKARRNFRGAPVEMPA
jgi:hypothetical protein